MDADSFRARIAEGYNRIPLLHEQLADLDTPVSAYLKLAGGPYSYLLESVQGGESSGRYSIIGLSCPERLVVHGQRLQHWRHEHLLNEQQGDPLAYIESFLAAVRCPELPDMPRFAGGLAGYFGYESIAYIEPRLRSVLNKDDPIGAPDILLLISDELLVFDNLRGRVLLIVHVAPNMAAYQQGMQRLASLQQQLRQPLTVQQAAHSAPPDHGNEPPTHSFTQAEFVRAIERCQQYISAGDVMQVVLSQRQSLPFGGSPFSLYRVLRALNPSPYLFYFHCQELHIVGSSPEILVRKEGRQATLRPLAGSRPRGATKAADLAFEKELLQDEKECAEHLMLIDLGRNDIGRICLPGTVRLTQKMAVERYSHIMHIVSNVVGELPPQCHAMALLRACFPAGTISGAPKIRAMEIIAELEPIKRGIYSGAVGYLSWSGNMDTAIAIRTAVIHQQRLHIQAGCGLVYDSQPATEWQETLNKARALIQAACKLNEGLDPDISIPPTT